MTAKLPTTSTIIAEIHVFEYTYICYKHIHISDLVKSLIMKTIYKIPFQIAL